MTARMCGWRFSSICDKQGFNTWCLDDVTGCTEASSLVCFSFYQSLLFILCSHLFIVLGSVTKDSSSVGIFCLTVGNR